jgi:hypothetical protein
VCRADVRVPGRPSGGGAVLADDREDGRQPVLGVEMGEVVGPARRLVRVLFALGLDGEDVVLRAGGLEAQHGVDAPFQRIDLGDVGREQFAGDGVGERDADGPGGAGEESWVLLEDPVHHFVWGTDHGGAWPLVGVKRS